MTGHSILVQKQREVLQEIHGVVQELDPEAARRMTHHTPGNILPNTTKLRTEYDLALLEAMLVLARAVRRRRGGRPRNIDLRDSEAEPKAS